MSTRAFILALFLASCAHRADRESIPPSQRPVGDSGVVRAERIAYTPADELLATVSADGRRVAYVTTESGNLDILLKTLATGSVVPLTVAAADDFDPSYAPVSDRLLFVSRRDDAKGDIYVIDADGTSLARLSDESTADRQPAFSPDEKRIYFTRAELLGEEHIAVIDLDAEATRVLSPTPGFDPAPSPDGRYLVYTAPPGVGGRRHPHLVALRLTDGATRALTLGDSPAGFGRFVTQTSSSAQIVMVRFPDDDDADGSVDANDKASLWSFEVALDRLFAGGAIGAPLPLTAGTSDELFPWPAPPWIYFTESAGNEQNVSRIPIAGMFANEPAGLEDRREQWFALRARSARAGGDASTDLMIANLHLDARRPDLARLELEKVIRAGADPEPTALAGVGLIAIEREEGLGKAAGERERREVLDRASAALDAIPLSSARLEARVALERAEIAAGQGDRPRALSILDALIEAHAGISDVAARALVRRTGILRVDFDPVALTEAYGEVLRRYPGERGLGAEAARRIVDAWTASARDRGVEVEIASLRRAIGRIDLAQVRVQARRRIVERLRAAGAMDLIAVELRALADEAEAAGDRSTAAQALSDLAVNEENRGALAEALGAWTRIRESYGDLAGLGAIAREAITRVALANARKAEVDGKVKVARDLYAAVLANDARQVTAHRRSLALAALAGEAAIMQRDREAASEREPTDPILRYAHALALTYVDPPDLERALGELDEVIRQNPLLAPAYIARGWVHEMLDDGSGTTELERAFFDYGKAAKIARDAQDHEVEAEALLNQGNASWRVADRTDDAGNFFASFRTYTTFLSLDGKLDRPETAMVFWERLSRAAIWSGEWATAVLAGREAIALSEKLGRKSRLPQLWANLALAYTSAGEPGYAEAAFKAFADASSEGAREERLIIAERNLALSKLDRLERTGEGDAESALADLERSRERIPRASFGPLFPGDLLTVTVPNATRAPFGFTGPLELDLNLGATGDAYRMQGDLARARRIDASRLELVRKLVDDSSPLALSLVREWLGLALVDVSAGACRVIDDACRDAFGAIHQRFEALVTDGRTQADRAMLELDRARLVAFAAELDASRPHVRPVDPTRVHLLLPDHNTAIVRALDWTRPTITSSTAMLIVDPTALETAALHARLLHAQGLRTLAGLDHFPPAATSLESVLAGLDAALPAAEAAKSAFAEAAAVAAKVPTPFGARVRAAALHGISEAELRGAITATVTDTASIAISAARAYGEDQLAANLTLARALHAGDPTEALEAISAAWPLPSDPGLIDRAFGRAFALALAGDDPTRTFAIADRWLVVRSIAGTSAAIDGAFDPADAAVISAYRAAAAEIAVAAGDMRDRGVESVRDFTARMDAARTRLAVARAAMAKVLLMPASPALEARLFGKPMSLEDVQAALAPHQALMIAIDAGGRRAYLVVRGSTTAEALTIDVREPGEPVPLPPEPTEWVVADDLLSEPLVLPELPASRVSSPTALAAASEQQRLGLAEAWFIGSNPPIEGARPVTADDLRALAQPVTSDRAVGRPPARSLEAQPAAERLRGRPLELYVIDEDVDLVERAPERSPVRLAPRADPFDPVKAVLPLATAVRPANVVVLTKVSGEPPRGLDVAMAVRGVASTVLIPADLARPAAARIIAMLAKERHAHGLAHALHRAIRAEIVAFPAARRVRLVGAPGLDEDAMSALATRRQAPLRARTTALVKGGKFADAVPVAGEYVRALGISGDTGASSLGAHQLLVASLSRTEQWARAAQAQQEMVQFLDARATADLKKKNLVSARLELAVLLSRARDVAASDAVIASLLDSLEKSGDQTALATVHARTAEAARARLDFPAAARAYERAIATYEGAGAYSANPVPPEAQDVLRRLAALYLNQLSDSVRARALFARALDYATKPEIKTALLLDLARVARRRGEFEEAAQRAETAREAARAMKSVDLGLEALIEATNIAWYRGDLARGRSLCNEALAQAEAQLKAARMNRLASSRAAQVRMIYVLSACGLVDMSSGDFAGAERTLLSAVRLARAGGDALEPEAAAQYNNLGRVYLEYGRLAQAVEAFETASRIDDRRSDRFGLAYDLRNLGTAQAAQGLATKALATLERALALANEVQDDNNQLRALVVLGDLAREAGRDPEAMERYQAALVIAERTDNLDLGSQIHRAMGLIHEARGDLSAARTELLSAIDSARRLPGRAGATEFGPHRYAPFDDLISLEIASGAPDRAFEVAEHARALAQTSILDDERVAKARPAMARDLSAIRSARTASAALELGARLSASAPRVFARSIVARAAEIQTPDDAAIIVYRPTDVGLVVFAIEGGTVTATVVPVTATQLGTALRDYRRQLDRRADLSGVQADLARWLVAPVAPRLANKRRLAIVAQGGLRAVAFAALPFAEGALIDELAVLYAPDPTAAARVLGAPPLSLASRPIIALAAPAGDDGADVPLVFAPREIEVIREAHPSAEITAGPGATRARWLEGLARPGSVAHFAGHSRLQISDPLASTLRFAGEPIALHEIFGGSFAASLAVLSACETLIAPDPALSPAAVARREPVSFADALSIAGAHAVLATTIQVDDVSAAMVMKRFYRFARTMPVAEALQAAQKAVRELDPHPAAWATFSLLVAAP